MEATRREAMDESMLDLRGGTRFAVTSPLGLLASKNESIRLSASRAVLEFAQRGLEAEELAARIETAIATVAGGS